MKAVIYGSLIHHLTDTLLAKVKTAWNVGRGALVDEDALYAALKEKRIRGATLDVWYAYPDRRWSEIAANLDRLARGEPLRYQLE